ncbi:MAG: LamG domain-containing protein, partial [Anaerolineae bacterium]|nr:LamG domain-containing protein [Anaerolineae bacterium]
MLLLARVKPLRTLVYISVFATALFFLNHSTTYGQAPENKSPYRKYVVFDVSSDGNQIKEIKGIVHFVSPANDGQTLILAMPDQVNQLQALGYRVEPVAIPEYTAEPITNSPSHFVYLPLIFQTQTGENVPLKLSPLAVNLQGHWTLDETTGQRLDSSGNDNHLADINGVGSVAGPVGGAADFPLANQSYLLIDDVNHTGLDITGDLTMVGWVKFNSSEWLRQAIISKYDGDDHDQRSYRLVYRPEGTFVFNASRNGNYQNNFELTADAPNGIVSGTWYHLAGVYDSTGQTMALYLDGDLIGSRTVTHSSIYDSSAPFIIGADMRFGYIDRYFDGALDDWQVYGDALTETEIEDLMALGTPPAPDPPPPPVTPPTRQLPLTCNPTNGSGGLAPGSYVTTVAGLDAAVVVGDGYNPNTPTYLAYFLHGDGGNYDPYASTSNEINQYINEQDWIFVSPLAPNGQKWWDEWVGDHNVAFAQVLDEMFANYNVCRDIVFGSGGSGGAEFLTSYFFPALGATYPAHMVLTCGGGQDDGNSFTRQQVEAHSQMPAVVNNTTFDYVFGTEDYLYSSVIG